MRYVRDGRRVHLRVGATPARRSARSYRGDGDLFHAEPGSLEEFLTERYCLYTEDGGRALPRRDPPPPWELQHGEAHVDLNTMAPLPLPDGRAARALLAAAGRRHLAARRARRLPSGGEPAAPLSARLGRRGATLVVLKLSVGLATHSLGLISEAVHSGTDLVAALLTYFAIRVAARPADVAHQFGHGKAEHLSALGEAAFLVARERVHLGAGDRAARRLDARARATRRGTRSPSSAS